MTSGWRIVCSDGISRHTELFPTRRDALTWQTFRHVCPFGHHPPRREAEWEVESFRLRPANCPSAPTSTESPERELHGAEGPNVGAGGPSQPARFLPPVPTLPAGAR